MLVERRIQLVKMVITLRRVLISDEVDPKCVTILQNNGIEVVKNTKLSKEDLIAEIKNYDGLIVRSATKVTADVINAATNLKIIGRAGTGVDNIDCSAATKKGIIVMNTPGGNTLSAAEHTCALIVAMTRELSLAAQSMKEGRWERKRFMGTELNGKTLAIIGLGRIGKEVALRMQSFGMTTIGFDPIIGGDISSTFNVEWMPLKQIWQKADYITVHTPLIPQTTNLINDAVFASCKKGVRVINCARGGIIDEAALLSALESGQCGGAGLDVFTEEPPTDYTLIRHSKVIATPHLGASTKEAQSRVAEEIAQQFVDLAQGKSLFGAINAPALANALTAETRPWVSLCEGLGVLASTLAGKGQNQEKQFQLISYGSSLKSAGLYVSAAFQAGYLRNSPSSAGDATATLNLISAPVLAKEVGLQVSVTNEETAPSPHSDLVAVILKRDDGRTLQISGTVAGTTPVLTEIEGAVCPVPPSLQGAFLIFKAKSEKQLIPSICDGVFKAGASLLNLSLSEPVNSFVWGVLNLAAPLPSGLEVIKNHVMSVNQIVL